MADIVVVRSPSLSKPWDDRFVVADGDTGEILDDAQGYGYKTARKAHAAWAYKHQDKAKVQEKAQKTKEIKAWMKSHREFVGLMDQFSFEIAKGSHGPDDRFDAKFVRELLRDHGLKPEFTPGELLKVWSRGKL